MTRAMKFTCRVWALGFGVLGFGFGVWGLGFGIYGEEFGSQEFINDRLRYVDE